jgi:DNA polymerase III subunit delta'
MWKDIISHSSEIDLLKSYIHTNKIPRTLLFSGMKGIGKSMVALEFFKALNCTSTPAEPCDKCGSCIKADNGNHPDLIKLISDGSEIRVDDVRKKILNELSLKPFLARYRVVIIEPAETLNKSSANILLKSLEEPPNTTIFILISHKPSLLLPTIISRCQEITFKSIASDNVDLNLDPVILKLTSGAIGGLVDSDVEYVSFIRNKIISILNGSDPFSAAESITRKDGDILIALSIIESFIRDFMVVNLGSRNVINEEVLSLSLLVKDSYFFDNISRTLNEIRSMQDSSINMKTALSGILYRMGNIIQR